MKRKGTLLRALIAVGAGALVTAAISGPEQPPEATASARVAGGRWSGRGTSP